MNFKVRCPDCQADQVVASHEIIFNIGKKITGQFACVSRSCHKDAVKQRVFSSQYGIAELAKQGKVETTPTGYFGFKLFLESALKHSGSRASFNPNTVTQAKILHAFTVLHLKASRINYDPAALLWYTAVVDALEENPSFVKKITEQDPGPHSDFSRYSSILLQQAGIAA